LYTKTSSEDRLYNFFLEQKRKFLPLKLIKKFFIFYIFTFKEIHGRYQGDECYQIIMELAHFYDLCLRNKAYLKIRMYVIYFLLIFINNVHYK